MDLKSCYLRLGGDYDEVLGRLHKESLVEKFLFKFLDDGSFRLLEESFANGNHEEAFRAAHTLKGVCQNLSFTQLYRSSNEMTEFLRGGTGLDAPELLAQVTADYRQTVDAILAYQTSREEHG